MTEALVLSEPETPVNLGLFGTADPVEVIERASRIATALADVVNKRKLYAIVNGRKFPTVEGWTLLGGMVGVFAHTEWVKPVVNTEGQVLGYHARVVAKRLNGGEVGAAEAMCMRGESKQWGQDAKDFALMSMAQTRATSKAMANPLRWIFKLAGYEGAAAEEMTVTKDGEIPLPLASPGTAQAYSEAAQAEPGVSEAGSPPAAIQPTPPVPTEKRGPGRPRKDGTPPQPKRTNVVNAQVKQPTLDEAQETLKSHAALTKARREDVRQRAAILAHYNAIVRNHSEERVMGTEPKEEVPPLTPNSQSDAALATMIGRREFFPGERLDTLGHPQLQRLGEVLDEFIAKRRDQLRLLGVDVD